VAGVPVAESSPGALFPVGDDFLFSGDRWITIFTGAARVIMGLSINLPGGGLRDAPDSKLR
jgi:peptide/nickel transport system permease protein